MTQRPTEVILKISVVYIGLNVFPTLTICNGIYTHIYKLSSFIEENTFSSKTALMYTFPAIGAEIGMEGQPVVNCNFSFNFPS